MENVQGEIMKLLITTRADERIKHFSDISHPIFKRYAEKVGADFSSVASPSLPDSADASVLSIWFE